MAVHSSHEYLLHCLTTREKTCTLSSRNSESEVGDGCGNNSSHRGRKRRLEQSVLASWGHRKIAALFQWDSRVSDRGRSPLRVLTKKGICTIEKEGNRVSSPGAAGEKMAKRAESTWPVWGVA